MSLDIETLGTLSSADRVNTIAKHLKSIPLAQRAGVMETVQRGLKEREAARLTYNWNLHARDSQLPPEGDWDTWLILAGRGFGKTRTGAEWVRDQVESRAAHRIALVARTLDEAQSVMIEGESGIVNISPPWDKPTYEPSKRKLTWPNGAHALVFSSHEPDQLRGPQFDAPWCDELASWEYPAQTWDNLTFALRLGRRPRSVVTTTPKSIELVRSLPNRPGVQVTRGSTYENQDNLPPAYFNQLIEQYDGTRIGQQEIYAELIDEDEDAIWKREWIEKARLSSHWVRFYYKTIIPDSNTLLSLQDNETPSFIRAKMSSKPMVRRARIMGVPGTSYICPRLGRRPRSVVTTTPTSIERPQPRRQVRRPSSPPATYENQDNLPPAYHQLIEQFNGHASDSRRSTPSLSTRTKMPAGNDSGSRITPLQPPAHLPNRRRNRPSNVLQAQQLRDRHRSRRSRHAPKARLRPRRRVRQAHPQLLGAPRRPPIRQVQRNPHHRRGQRRRRHGQIHPQELRRAHPALQGHQGPPRQVHPRRTRRRPLRTEPAPYPDTGAVSTT